MKYVDGNNQLSFTEYLDSVEALFDKLDADTNGKLSAAELKKFMTAQDDASPVSSSYCTGVCENEAFKDDGLCDQGNNNCGCNWDVRYIIHKSQWGKR